MSAARVCPAARIGCGRGLAWNGRSVPSRCPGLGYWSCTAWQSGPAADRRAQAVRSVALSSGGLSTSMPAPACHGAILRPALADAVLFTDETELLACLAREWLADRVSGPWFWRALFGDAAPGRMVAEAFRQYGASLPAVFGLLATEGVAVVAKLPDVAAAVARAAMAAAHGVPLDSVLPNRSAYQPEVGQPEMGANDRGWPAQRPRRTRRQDPSFVKSEAHTRLPGART